MKLLEQENLQLAEDIHTLNEFHENKEITLRNELNYLQTYSDSLADQLNQ